MEIRLSTPAADTDLAALESLYLDAFPPEERRPWDAIVNPAEKGCPQLRAIYAGECLAGLVTTWTLGPVLYVEHLAVDPAMRGSGIGAAVMAALIADASPLALLLEVEPESDDNPMAARRIGFYRRCGLDILPYPYIQPPYAPGFPPSRCCLCPPDPTSIPPRPQDSCTPKYMACKALYRSIEL